MSLIVRNIEEYRGDFSALDWKSWGNVTCSTFGVKTLNEVLTSLASTFVDLHGTRDLQNQHCLK